MRKLLASCFGLGYMPFAPGTWGSLPPVIAYQALAYVAAGGIIDAWIIPASQVLLLLYGCLTCIIVGPYMVRLMDKPDPQQVVADEVAGQALAMLIISLGGPCNICSTAVLGFVLFRLFDITKPWPCKRLERFVGGWGILMDDLMAGLYAGVLSLLLIRFIPQIFG